MPIHVVNLKFTKKGDAIQGVAIEIPVPKTDQDGAGRTVGIPFGANPETCPVLALRAWLKESGIKEGPVFKAVNRHGRVSERALYPGSVSRILKRAAARAGYDVKPISGHSLRAGHCTEASANSVPELTIMRQTGHRSVSTLRRYIRQGDLFKNNSAGRLGL
jgi:integrase